MFVVGQNLALNKPAYQISTTADGPPQYAVGESHDTRDQITRSKHMTAKNIKVFFGNNNKSVLKG